MGSNQLANECKELLEAKGELCNQVLSYLKTMSLKCAVDLGIPDVIHNHAQPMTLSELHSALCLSPSKIPHFRRLMRILTHSGFFSEHHSHADRESTYDLTPISRLVINKEGSSNLALLIRTLLHDTNAMNASREMSGWFKKDSLTPCGLPFEADFWDLKNWQPGFHELFTEGMASNSRFVLDVITKNCGDVFKGIKSLVDVGGGNGSTAKMIANNFPHIKRTVLDLPQVVGHLTENDAVKFVAGDMFNYVPTADAVFLKWVTHKWSDEECIRILKRCREAIPSKESGGKVIIIDCLIGSNPDMVFKEFQLLNDILMMVVTKGAERDEQQFANIFKEAGFSSYKIAYALGCESVIEIYQ